jgi:hypothetical protein
MTCDGRKKSPAWVPITGAAALLFLPALSMATSITGDAVLNAGNGTVLVSGNGATSGCIIWSTGGTPPPSTCPTSGNGTFTVGASSNPPFTAGDTGTIDNLNFNSLAGGPLVDFMKIDGVQFDLTSIAYNTGPTIGECSATIDSSGMNWDSPGASCIPAGSPFELENGLATNSSGNADTVSVTLTVGAEAYTGSSGTNYSAATPYVGIFTTQSSEPITGNIQTLIAAIESGGNVTAAWSANFTPAPAPSVPEPETDMLCGGGLILLAMAGKRFRSRRGEEHHE